MSERRPTLTRQIAFAGIAAAEWFALGLQFYLTLKMQPLSVAGTLKAALLFGSFFTIFSSTLVAIVSTRLAIDRDGRFRERSKLPTASAVYITIVGTVWMVFLRGTYPLSGLWLVADGLMHVVLPPSYVLAWALLLPKGSLAVRDAAVWLLLPLLYLEWMFTCAAFDGWYPYSFLNVTTLGYVNVALITFGLLIVFWMTGLLFIFVDRILAKR